MKNNSLAWVDKLGKDDVVKLMSYAEGRIKSRIYSRKQALFLKFERNSARVIVKMELITKRKALIESIRLLVRPHN